MLGRDPTGSELAAGGLTASISHIIPTFVLEQGTLDVRLGNETAKNV